MRTFPLIQRHVEAIELVSDDEIVEAMRLLFERSKVVVEPSGACALAGLLRHGEALFEGRLGQPHRELLTADACGGVVLADQVLQDSRDRLERGWSPERAVSEPVDATRRNRFARVA